MNATDVSSGHVSSLFDKNNPKFRHVNDVMVYYISGGNERSMPEMDCGSLDDWSICKLICNKKRASEGGCHPVRAKG